MDKTNQECFERAHAFITGLINDGHEPFTIMDTLGKCLASVLATAVIPGHEQEAKAYLMELMDIFCNDSIKSIKEFREKKAFQKMAEDDGVTKH